MSKEKLTDEQIIDKLREEIEVAQAFGDKLRRVETKDLEDYLNLINRLKEENAELKDRIAELEKENATKTDTIVDLLNKQEFYEKEKLTKFAERLKEKALSHCRTINCYELTFIETTIDELLKELQK